MIAFISCGSIQLLVGPASFSSTEQMKVRSSTRATSEGAEAQWNEFGFLAGSRRVNVPEATRESVISVHSSSEPVHQWMRSGVVMAATSETKSRIPWCVVGAVSCVVAQAGVSRLMYGCPSRTSRWPRACGPEMGHRSVLRRGEREVVAIGRRRCRPTVERTLPVSGVLTYWIDQGSVVRGTPRPQHPRDASRGRPRNLRDTDSVRCGGSAILVQSSSGLPP